MHCAFPKPAGDGLRSCGGCYNCRINQRRVWTGRILLESLFYPETSFVTLTYEDSHLPIEDGVEVLSRKDYERFIRQFKRSPWGPRLRYYGVAEYGDESARPHYHFILFGVGLGWLEELKRAWSVRRKREDVSEKAVKEGRMFKDAKGKLREMIGYVTCEPLTPERAAYAARYVVKKMHKPDDTRLKGRPPEWRSMSKQCGGLGISALGWLADMHTTNAGSKALQQRRDVFNAIKVDGKVYPIGEYLRCKLRELLGVLPTQSGRDLASEGYHNDQELPFAPPMDLYSVRSLPRNRRIIDAEKLQVAPEALARIEANARKAKKRLPSGARI
jgi:hypothetical protein